MNNLKIYLFFISDILINKYKISEIIQLTEDFWRRKNCKIEKVAFKWASENANGFTKYKNRKGHPIQKRQYMQRHRSWKEHGAFKNIK